MPIAARSLSIRAAWIICLSSLILGNIACRFQIECNSHSLLTIGSTIVQFNFSPVIKILYHIGLLLGTLYSVPPFQLKRYPLFASGIISTVRGFLLNFGVYYAVREALNVPFQWNPVVMFISTFMTVFAAVIAITKVKMFNWLLHEEIFSYYVILGFIRYRR